MFFTFALIAMSFVAGVLATGTVACFLFGFRHWRWHLDEVFVKINGRRVRHNGHPSRSV